MIKKLRYKFIAVTMLSVVLVLFLLMGMINYANFRNVNRNLSMRLDLIEENGGKLPDDHPDAFRHGPGENAPDDNPPPAKPEDAADGTPSFSGNPPDNGRRKDNNPGLLFFRNGLSGEAFFDTRYFTVSLDASGSVCAVNVDRIATVSEDEAKALALALDRAGRTGGYENEYKFRAVTAAGDESGAVTMYIFLNAGRELDTLRTFLSASVAVSVIGSLLILLLVVILSKIVVRPVAESYEKQKRFITDASHEIKTPLAIIGANIEVVEMEAGESEWTKSIRNQIRRLSSLTEKLVFLSRMDEEGSRLMMTKLDLSSLVRETAEGFIGSAVSSGRTLILDIAPSLSLNGDAATLSQLVSLLLDNAMKYASDNSEIKLTLEPYHKGKYTARLIETNAADNLEKGNLDVLFERFYRQDASRNSQTGGHGIGLSVAAAIVRAHGGRIHAQSPDGRMISFTVLL